MRDARQGYLRRKVGSRAAIMALLVATSSQEELWASSNRPRKWGFGDLKDDTLDGERGLHLDDSNYGKGLDLGFGINNYPHRLSYADQARNHAENVGASSSEEDVSGRFPAQHSPDFAREYSMFTPANRTVTVPLAIHRAGHAHHAHRGSVAESILSESTVVGSPQSAKLAGSFPSPDLALHRASHRNSHLQAYPLLRQQKSAKTPSLHRLRHRHALPHLLKRKLMWNLSATAPPSRTPGRI